ncbi:MAG: hypothetical protein SVY53_08795 [Chloroflexota bacterium]|nr:hypothetical protein [Chloroflexota bacterium]
MHFSVESSQGDHKRSKECIKYVLRILEAHLGEDHPITVAVAINLEILKPYDIGENEATGTSL